MTPDVLHRLFSAPPEKVLIVLLALLIGAAVYDIRYRRIPNWLTIAGVLLGFAINFGIGPPEGGVLFALEGFGLAFGLYMFLYLLRAMGAGDVKLMAAVGALVAVRGRLKRTFFNVAFILSEIKHGRPAYVGKEELDVRSGKAVGLPHGAVIAIGTIFFLAICGRLAR